MSCRHALWRCRVAWKTYLLACILMSLVGSVLSGTPSRNTLNPAQGMMPTLPPTQPRPSHLAWHRKKHSAVIYLISDFQKQVSPSTTVKNHCSFSAASHLGRDEFRPWVKDGEGVRQAGFRFIQHTSAFLQQLEVMFL